LLLIVNSFTALGTIGVCIAAIYIAFLDRKDIKHDNSDKFNLLTSLEGKKVKFRIDTWGDDDGVLGTVKKVSGIWVQIDLGQYGPYYFNVDKLSWIHETDLKG
jgi:hypothetical protein